jgi:hypothetical protein
LRIYNSTYIVILLTIKVYFSIFLFYVFHFKCINLNYFGRVSCKERVICKTFVVITSIYFTVLYYHLTHIWSGRINYGYNMKFNVVVGNE